MPALVKDVLGKPALTTVIRPALHAAPPGVEETALLSDLSGAKQHTLNHRVPMVTPKLPVLSNTPVCPAVPNNALLCIAEALNQAVPSSSTKAYSGAKQTIHVSGTSHTFGAGHSFRAAPHTVGNGHPLAPPFHFVGTQLVPDVVAGTSTQAGVSGASQEISLEGLHQVLQTLGITILGPQQSPRGTAPTVSGRVVRR